RPGQEQVCHVGACYQQHKPYRAKKNHQRGSDVTDELVTQRRDRYSPSLVEVRILLFIAPCERVHLRLRSLDCDVGLQPGDRKQVSALANAGVGPERHRQPEIRLLADHRTLLDIERNVPGHDADHRRALAVERYVLANYRWISSKATLPEPVAQDRDIVLSLLSFFGHEGASLHRGSSEQVEEVRSHQLSD